MVQLCICARTLCSCDYNDNERNICMCFKLPLLPYDQLSKTLLSHRLVLFSKPASHLLLLLCSSPVRIILFNEKAKNGGKKTPHNNQNTKPLLARPLESILSQFFWGSVCIFTSCCSYCIGATVWLSAYLLVYWHRVLQYVYHNSTILLLSQLASVSGGLFPVWDCTVHPTHPEGI